jgi:hypothetical protein
VHILRVFGVHWGAGAVRGHDVTVTQACGVCQRGTQFEPCFGHCLSVFWNCGIFCCVAGLLVSEFRTVVP